jgi:hypothetical protein
MSTESKKSTHDCFHTGNGFAAVGAQFLIESKVWKWDLKVPGVISCNDEGGCPEGTTCGADLMCR